MKKHLTLFALLAVLLSCSKKDNCKETDFPVIQLESQYGCSDTRHTLTIDMINNGTIIADQNTYDALVTGDCHPSIDFSVYYLVIGRMVTDNINDTITYELRNSCPENDLVLTVNFFQSQAPGPDTITYHVLVPSLIYRGDFYVNLILQQSGQ